MRQGTSKGCLVLGLAPFALVLAIVGVVFLQASRTPPGPPVYVALGSSYAAGAGLGPLQNDSPLLCARSVNGYPQQLARLRKLAIVDMSCGGSVTDHVLHGGQFFQGPQVRAVSEATRLVTLTVGGNDIGYVGDLSLLAARHDHTAFGWLARTFWKGPKAAVRDYGQVRSDLVATLRLIHARAPRATVVVATYPTVLPASGTCPRLGLTVAEADVMRDVAARLAAATQSAAAEAGVLVVDMNTLGAAHNVCADAPWMNGWKVVVGAPFHPNLKGAQATAAAISTALTATPISPRTP